MGGRVRENVTSSSLLCFLDDFLCLQLFFDLIHVLKWVQAFSNASAGLIDRTLSCLRRIFSLAFASLASSSALSVRFVVILERNSASFSRFSSSVSGLICNAFGSA